MALIVFVVWPEAGHVNPTLALAKRLRLRGHVAKFVGWDTILKRIRSEGFEATDIFEALGLSGALEEWRANGGDSDDFLDARRSEAADHIARWSPAVVALDPLWWRLTLALTERRVSCVHLCTSLPDELDFEIAPWTSSHVPGQRSLRSWLERRASWSRVRLEQWLKYGLRLPVATDTLDIGDAARLLENASWPAGWAEVRAVHKPALGVPELILCPHAFELPQKRARPYRYYVEAGIDPERDDQASLPDVIAASERPLIVVSFGSRVSTYTEAGRVFSMVASAAHILGEFQFIVALGNTDVSAVRFPDNVQTLDWIPQLACLKRARVMLHHGGLNSVKECVMAGVPMCVVPFRWDQPSVAARVEYHGIGSCLTPRRLDTASLATELRRLHANPQYAMRVGLMRREFSRVALAEPGVQLLDGLLIDAIRRAGDCDSAGR